jgi:2-C-methyl-D-erythritol 2,4-cyclodiphosphate synthase
MMRIGHGYDVHQLVAGRDLILGGVKIPHAKGLLGHSDADVLLHAICDACLGAASLGDLGRHFPDSDPRYKNIDSRKLLRHVEALLDERGWRLENLDSTIIAQAPKLAPHIPAMIENTRFRRARRGHCGARRGSADVHRRTADRLRHHSLRAA